MKYAHSAKKDVPPQAYAAHIGGVSKLARQYATEAGHYAGLDGELLLQVVENAALYHDLGKLDPENQAVLSEKDRKKRLPVNHADAGVAHFLKEENFCALSAAVIQAHHIGFPDFIREMDKGESAFRAEEIAAKVDKELLELEAIHGSLVEDAALPTRQEIRGDRSVFLRLLLSCLADADHTDTAIHYGNYPAQEPVIPLCPAQRLEQLNRCIAQMQQDSADDARNALRDEMYHACRDAEISAGISSCDSPVGTGKTTAIMAHQLVQAIDRGLRRIFIILPFTNIISQSVQTYRKMLVLPGEDPQEVVAELHHRADFESEEARHLTALWRAPIVVTTAVAFFETLASNSTATLRRLHELPGSAIFVDESHAALPPSLLPIAWRWMKVLASQWSCYWVLASGSLNRFWTIPEIAPADDATLAPEVVNDPLRHKLSEYEHRRLSYRHDLQPKSTAELTLWIAGFPGPRLVILNTVQSAAVLADFFRTQYGRERVEHLSTALASRERDRTLKRIKDRLDDKQDADWTLVATSCAEAGLELSFRNGFRELGSLSSLQQASGRVDRQGIFGDSQMWTFCILEDGMLKLNPGLKNAAAVLKGYLQQNIPITPELTTRSIADEIKLYGLGGKHQRLVRDEANQNFPQVERDFRVIDSDTRLVVVDPDLAQRLRYGKVDWRELQKTSVQILKYKLEELRVPVIMDEIYGWNLEYDDFLGYMAGIIKLNKLSKGVIIL